LSAEIWLVRHAEPSHAGVRYLDEGLSERGRAQARALGRALRAAAVDAAWTSPLPRARETAALALESSGIEARVEPCLAEGSYGDFEGLAAEEARARHPSFFRLGPGVVARLAATGATAPGGESREAFVARALAARRLVEAALERPGGITVAFSHGGLLNYLLQALLGPAIRDEVRFGFEFCGVARVHRFREQPAFGPHVQVVFGAQLASSRE
jgi:probable phosphoglycerate mutase